VDGSLLKRSLELALAVDPEESKAYVTHLRERFPDKDRRELADLMISRARWWGAGVGFATGVPGNPWVAAPAAVTDVAAVLRTEILLACRIGLLFDPQLLDGPEPPYEVLVPIMGSRAASAVARNLLTLGGMGITRQAIRKGLNAGGLWQFRKIMLKYFGLKVSGRGVITKTLPVVGGLIGGAWNYAELKIVGDRVYRYFDGQALSVD
jgi:hypothetical protein